MTPRSSVLYPARPHSRCSTPTSPGAARRKARPGPNDPRAMKIAGAFLCLLLAPGLAAAEAPTGAPAAPRRPVATVIVPALAKPATAGPRSEKDMGGYLMVYFKDETHSAYFAISRDGYSFTDVNGGDPVFDGAALAE